MLALNMGSRLASVCLAFAVRLSCLAVSACIWETCMHMLALALHMHVLALALHMPSDTTSTLTLHSAMCTAHCLLLCNAEDWQLFWRA